MRTDSLYLIGELRSAQIVSIIGIAVGIIAIVYRRLNVKPVVHYLDSENGESGASPSKKKATTKGNNKNNKKKK